MAPQKAASAQDHQLKKVHEGEGDPPPPPYSGIDPITINTDPTRTNLTSTNMPDHIVNLREDVPGTTVVSTSNSENGRGNLYGNNGNRRIIGGLLVAINCGELLDTITGVFTKLLDAIAGIPIKLLDTITGIFIRLLDALIKGPISRQAAMVILGLFILTIIFFITGGLRLFRSGV